MKSYAKYIRRGKPDQYQRAFREVFLFQMINYFDSEYLPDDAEGVDDYEPSHLTLEQKRRLRNQIYSIANTHVNEHNTELAKAKANGQRMEESDLSTCDTDMLVSAFFETDYGKKYASKSIDWSIAGNARRANETLARQWTLDQDQYANGVRRIAISPYDPLFVKSDVFTDDTDEAGYLIAIINPDGTPRLSANGGQSISTNAFMKAPNGDLLIKSVHLGDDHLLAPVEQYQEIARSPWVDLEDDVTKSGYHAVEHFIKTKSDKADIRKYLVDLMSKPRPDATPDANGNYADGDLIGAITEDEEQFMSDVCKYLTARGVEFDVKLSKDNKLVAEIGSRTEIRLLDRGDEQYQGRIFDNGTIVRLGISSGGRMTYKSMTNKDRMDVIKWYFGEDIQIDTTEWNKAYPHDAYNRPRYVGEMTTLKSDVKINSRRSSRPGEKEPFVSVSVAPSRMNESSIFLKHKSVTTTVPGGKTYTNIEPLNIMVSSSAVNNKSDSDEMMFADSIKPGKVKIPLERAIAGDIDVNDAGEQFVNVSKHEDYYTSLAARNELDRWVETAKTAHAEAVNLDDMINAFMTVKKVDPDYEYDFSADENIAEIQMLYWDVLTGKVKSLSNDMTLSDNEDADNAESNKLVITSVGDTDEERIDAVRRHFANYQNESFGSVPDIDPDGVVGDSTGFVPEMVAQYINTDNSYGIQKNYSFIKHMLKQVGPKYNKSFIKGDNYVSRMMKNDMISFDKDKTVARFNLAMITRPGSLIIDRNKLEDLMKTNKDFQGLQDKPVTRDMLIHTALTLAKSGCEPNNISVAIDENGIIAYSAYCNTKKTSTEQLNVKSLSDRSDWRKVSGSIGQVFEPDRYGVITPKFAVSNGKVMVPGYDAYLLENDPENPTPMRDRLRLTGWQTLMRTEITRDIHKAVFTLNAEYNFLPHTTDLNTVYKHSYDTELSEADYLSRLPKDPDHPTPEEQTYLNCIETLAGRCRFPNEYGENATTTAQAMLEHPDEEAAKTFDYYYSDLCDNKNLRVLSEDFDGIFDADATGTAKTQGIVRYLAKGATVDAATGKVASVDYDPSGEPPRCALMSDDLLKYKDHDSWDRRQMATSQILTALHTPRHVGAAMMNMDGWNFDDGFIVSKSFAERYAIDGVDGDKRPLMVQDKLSDLHGNKGVISLVIDPTMSTDDVVNRVEIDRRIDTRGLMFDDESLSETDVLLDGKSYHVAFDPKSKDSHKVQAAHQIQKQLGMDGIDDIIKVFKDNPDLDVVMSPYSGMSRANGGSIKSLMDEPQDLYLNGKTIKGGMGYTDMIVVDMPSDVKTHFYTQDHIMAGKGRKASGQLAWALSCNGCRNIMSEMFGSNSSALDNFREYAITVGLDIDANANLKVGYHPQSGRNERRNLIKLPDELPNLTLPQKSSDRANRNRVMKGIRLDDKQLILLKGYMMASLNANGGFMELPFQLDFKTLSYVKGKSYDKSVKPEDFLTQPTGQTYTVNGEEKPTYGMPVLSQKLRSGQDFIDGTSRPHDYTMRYMNVYKDALLYMACERRIGQLDRGEVAPDAKGLVDRQMLVDLMDRCKADAQSEFDVVVRDVVEHRFDTKHNQIRDGIMANRLSRSATAVWSADPRLKLDEVGMNTKHAQMLGLCDDSGKLMPDAEVLVWRDPVLKEGNIRSLRVVIREDVNGIVVNPLIDKSFDGDFDGDSVGLNALLSKEARAEAHAAFAMENNLLCPGVKDPKTGDHPLYIQDGLDIASNSYARPELNERRADIIRKLNDLEKQVQEVNKGHMSVDEITAQAPIKKKNGRFLVRDANGNPTYETEIGPDGTERLKMSTVRGRAAIRQLRQQYKAELDAWSKDALSGIATDMIRFDSEKSVVESFQHIVDDGAKGNQSKMKGLMDNIGITYELGEDGRADLSTVKRIEDENGNMIPKNVAEGINRKVDKDIQATAAYKADNTALGGTSAQAAVAAFREFNIMAACEITYPITQSILQSKHDPKDAKIKDEIVRFWGKDIWDGYKLTGDFTLDDPEAIQKQPHKRIMVPVLDEKGNPVPRKQRVEKLNANGEPIRNSDGTIAYEYQVMTDKKGNVLYEQTYERCTRDEWVTQMKGMMKALKVDVNYDYIEELADIMVREQAVQLTSAYTGARIYGQTGNQGTIAGVTDFAKEHGSLMDSLAYNGKFSSMVDEATKPDERKLSAGSLFSNAVTASICLAQARDEYMEAKASGDAERKKIANQELEHAKTLFRESSLFAPKSFVEECIGDIDREATGETRNKHVKHSKDGEDRIVYTDPKPLGCKDCRISQDDFNNGGAFMGELQADYEARLRAVDSIQRNSDGDTNDGAAVSKEEALSAVGSASTRKVTASQINEAIASAPSSSSNGNPFESYSLN